MELIIEEISRGKKLIGRHKFATDSITIGRGYQNDIILSDPHVCADHLAIKLENGIWYIRDLESLNGSRLTNKTPITSWQVLNSGDIIRIGKSQLRFFCSSHPVAESLHFSATEELVESIGRWPIVIAMLLLFSILNFTMYYLNQGTKEIQYSDLFISVVGITIAYALWPLLCSLIAFMNKQEPRISSQLGVSFVIINLFWLVDFVNAFLGFNLSSQWAWQWLIAITAIVLTFAMLWFNFFIAFNQTNKRRVKIALGITVFIYGGLYLQDMSVQPEFNPYPVYDSTLMTPEFSISGASSSDEFIEQSKELFDVAKEKANEE